MATCLLQSMGNGIFSDDCTAKASEVLKGYKYFGNDTDEDIKVGTLEPTSLGEFEGDADIDVSSVIRDTDTTMNFIVEPYSNTYLDGNEEENHSESEVTSLYVCLGTENGQIFTQKTISSNTLKVRGMSIGLYIGSSSGRSGVGQYELHKTINIKYRVYHI